MPHISSLYLFAKDTDATDAVRGYKYQELRTLETWLSNKNNRIEEDIYCDYEEDVFQKDAEAYTVRFTQIKLYSSKNFSFQSIEIAKAIAHFFMLFVKPDYLLDDPRFVFETNTSIAASRGENGSELLNEWVLNQDNLSEELLARCIVQLRGIIDKYMEAQAAAQPDSRDPEYTAELLETYRNLPKHTWEAFARAIRWNFREISANEAIEQAVTNIMESIQMLPYPLEREQYSIIFERLRGIVSDKSMAADPEKRKLTNAMITEVVLNLGSSDDRAYNQAFAIWKDVGKITEFNMAEFYTVLFNAKHCRRAPYLDDHARTWIQLLLEYYNDEDTPWPQKREAIYEIVWSTLRPKKLKKPTRSLHGLESVIEKYFEDFESYDSSIAVEDALNLLSTVDAVSRFGLHGLSTELLEEWQLRFGLYLEELLKRNPDNALYQIRLREIRFFFILNLNSLGYGLREENLQFLRECSDGILKLLPEAEHFSVSQLGERIDATISMFFSGEIDLEETRILEEFMERLEPFVRQRDNDMGTAKTYIRKGAEYLKSENPKAVLKALGYFHKAKKLYFSEDSVGGYLLGLLNISQFFLAIGMNIAAKHYALGAVWYAQHRGDPAHHKRIADGYARMFESEFRQGSWISALETFRGYVVRRNELHPKGFNIEDDPTVVSQLTHAAAILTYAPVISPQLVPYLQYFSASMGPLYTDVLLPYSEVLVEEFGSLSEQNVTAAMKTFVTSPPINDIGPSRTISWHALGSEWQIVFANDFTTNSIAEEFCSLVQIYLVEIASSPQDFHFFKSSIVLEVQVSDTLKQPEQIPDNDIFRWKVFLPFVDSRDVRDINFHYAKISGMLNIILSDLSVLPKEKFDANFMGVMANGIGDKTLFLHAYQIMYRNEFSEDTFNESMRNHFISESHTIPVKEASAMQWDSKLSSLFNPEEMAEGVRKRYEMYVLPLAMTLERVIALPEFQQRIAYFREKGWLDWQILLALMNTAVNYRTSHFLSNPKRNYASQEDYREHYNEVFRKLSSELETVDNYVEIPLRELIGPELQRHLDYGPLYSLGSLGLFNRASFPNYKAIRELLTSKFDYGKTDAPGHSPFHF